MRGRQQRNAAAKPEGQAPEVANVSHSPIPKRRIPRLH
jgi:hypothetical protein